MSLEEKRPPTEGWRNRITGHGEAAPDQLLANPRNWRVHPKAQQPGADAVDHITPAFRGGTDDHSNLAPIYDRVPPHCHCTKTAHEANPPRRRPTSTHPGALD